MSFFDEEPDGDLHGECALEIARLTKERNALLEACEALLGDVTKRGGCQCAECRPQVNQAIAAIAKARGEK